MQNGTTTYKVEKHTRGRVYAGRTKMQKSKTCHRQVVSVFKCCVVANAEGYVGWAGPCPVLRRHERAHVTVRERWLMSVPVHFVLEMSPASKSCLPVAMRGARLVGSVQHNGSNRSR